MIVYHTCLLARFEYFELLNLYNETGIYETTFSYVKHDKF